MLDVEYISELVVAYLHGPQNKKANLDKYCSAYEEDFERRTEVKSTFKKALSEIFQTFENLERSRWRKKSDFYSLFLAFAKRRRNLPFSSDARKCLHDCLMGFAADVDDYITNYDEDKRYARDVVSYADAVERAASDLANRKRRSEVLEKLFTTALE